MFKKIIIVVFYCSLGVLYGQNPKEFKDSLDVYVSKIIKKKGKHFCFDKASRFYLERQWDSTLVYSLQQINKKKTTQEILDFSHYYRGRAFYEKGIYKEALYELDKIPETFYFMDNVLMMSANSYSNLEEYSKSILIYKKLLKSSRRHTDRSSVLHNLGMCYALKDEFGKAEKYLKESERYDKQERDTIGLITTYGTIASLYYEQYLDAKAIPYFTKAYDLAKKSENFGLKEMTAKNMALVEENRKDYSKSLQYLKETQQWKDSIYNQNKVWETAKREKEFAVKQKQKEVSLLQAENKAKVAQRNALLTAAIFMVVLFAVGVYFYREKVKTNKVITEQKEDLDKLNTTKDRLFSIVSHDLRSSVNALKNSNSKLVKNLEDGNLNELDTLLSKNSAIVNGAYSLLDNLLHWALSQTKQSYFEMTDLRLYMLVEQMAYNYKHVFLNKNIQFENKIPKKTKVIADQESVKIILRNLLDNAVKFSKDEGRIKIYVEEGQTAFCDLIIEDNGQGMDEVTKQSILKNDDVLLDQKQKEMSGTGLGLQLCKSMIAKNKGRLFIESQLGVGTKMIVSLLKKS